jgi:hypothetical protein
MILTNALALAGALTAVVYATSAKILTHVSDLPERSDANINVPSRCDLCQATFQVYYGKGDCFTAMHKVGDSVSHFLQSFRSYHDLVSALT